MELGAAAAAVQVQLQCIHCVVCCRKLFTCVISSLLIISVAELLAEWTLADFTLAECALAFSTLADCKGVHPAVLSSDL